MPFTIKALSTEVTQGPLHKQARLVESFFFGSLAKIQNTFFAVIRTVIEKLHIEGTIVD